MNASIFGVLVVAIALAGFALWIYALVDAIQTPDDEFQSGTKLIWVLVILLANVIGAIIYLAIGRPSRRG